jgi:hypothetical protein
LELWYAHNRAVNEVECSPFTAFTGAEVLIFLAIVIATDCRCDRSRWGRRSTSRRGYSRDRSWHRGRGSGEEFVQLAFR